MNKSSRSFKFLIVLGVLITGATALQAQTSSGNMMIGGGLSFSSRSYQAGDANNSAELQFTPAFGYFVSDNFAVGATLALGSARDGVGDSKTVRTNFGIGPFARYYIFSSNTNFGFFGQAQLSFGTNKTNPPVGEVRHGNTLSFVLAPGAAFFFNEHWAVEFTIRGFVVESIDPNTDNDNDKYTNVSLGLNSLAPSLGFRYHF